MRKAGLRSPNHRIAILFVAFMACSLTSLCYQTRLSRLLPPDATSHPIIGSIKMTRESATPNAQIDDSENNQLENDPGVVTGGQVRSPIPFRHARCAISVSI